MKYIVFILLSTVLFLYVVSASFGEKKVKKEQIQKKIRAYIEQKYKGAQKVKYYIESDRDTTFYEVELRYEKEKISLTFLENGTLCEK